MAGRLSGGRPRVHVRPGLARSSSSSLSDAEMAWMATLTGPNTVPMWFASPVRSAIFEASFWARRRDLWHAQVRTRGIAADGGDRFLSSRNQETAGQSTISAKWLLPDSLIRPPGWCLRTPPRHVSSPALASSRYVAELWLNGNQGGTRRAPDARLRQISTTHSPRTPDACALAVRCAGP